MAERLTERHGKYINIQPKEEIMCSNYCTSCGKADCDHIRMALERLAHYEDLEEQGRLVELPCKIGDTVYGIRRYQDRIVKLGTVSEMYYNRDMEQIIAIKNVCRGCWGKQIFGTREETEAALKGAENDSL